MIISPHVANIGTPPQISERGSAPSCAGPLLFSSLHPRPLDPTIATPLDSYPCTLSACAPTPDPSALNPRP